MSRHLHIRDPFRLCMVDGHKQIRKEPQAIKTFMFICIRRKAACHTSMYEADRLRAFIGHCQAWIMSVRLQHETKASCLSSPASCSASCSDHLSCCNDDCCEKWCHDNHDHCRDDRSESSRPRQFYCRQPNALSKDKCTSNIYI
jgi:hypothetical protein